MKGNVNIERINIAAFGKLEQKEIELSPRVNLLVAPNEGGKSTLSGFIRFALYGFTGKSRGIAENPKKLYMPWSGAAASGALTVKADRRLRIERKVAGTKETVSCTDIATNTDMCYGNIGEELFGVGCEVFEKTLFLSTAEPPKSDDKALAEKLQVLMFSADEQTEGEKAEKLLTKKKNALKGRTAGSGRIYELETEAARLESKLSQEQSNSSELKRAEEEHRKYTEEISAREKEVAEAEAALANYENYEALLLLKEYERLQKEKEEKEAAETVAPTFEEIEKLQDLKRKADGAADALRVRHEEYVSACEAESKSTSVDPSVLVKCKKLSTFSKLFFALFLAGIALLVYSFFVPSEEGTAGQVGTGIFSALMLGAGIYCAAAKSSALKNSGFNSVKALEAAWEYSKETEESGAQRREAANRVLKAAEAAEEEARKELYEALSLYGEVKDSQTAINELLREHIASESLKAESKNAKDNLNAFLSRYDVESLKEKAKNAVEPIKEKSQLDIEKKAASQRLSLYKEKLSQTAQRIAALRAVGGNPVATAEALSYTVAEIEKAKHSYNALTIAVEELTAAGNELKESFSPIIAKRAGEYFNTLTDGEHSSMELDTSFAMSCDGDYGQKSGEYLSTGAKDGAYLCLRLALVELLFEGRKVPIVLDDAFARIDTPRTKRMLKMLCESGHQLIISSCSSREERLLKELGQEYSLITL
ncbi:MAG: AAA family ATPase [Clostridia bacterium]|nr:AAA family ATPase [Clostridia bacterium]